MGVAAHLGIRVRDYDAQIRTFIPHYEEMLDAAAGTLRGLGRGRPAIVDLGIGSGALAARCLAVVPRASLTGLDSDPAMLGLARERLGPLVELRRADFLKAALPRCDAIVASLALHHVPTRRRKSALYARCFTAVRPGGFLVNADCCLAASARLDALDQAAWRAHLERNYSRPHAARFLRVWAQEDVYFRLEDEIRLMRAAGFAVDLPWRRHCFAVVVGIRK